ncbi:MAG TPA: hypothetical protein VGF23_22960 [Gaiellaceae bacterium]
MSGRIRRRWPRLVLAFVLIAASLLAVELGTAKHAKAQCFSTYLTTGISTTVRDRPGGTVIGVLGYHTRWISARCGQTGAWIEGVNENFDPNRRVRGFVLRQYLDYERTYCC